MCRVLTYLGQPLDFSGVLFETDNSLVQQAHAPRMTTMANLAGFGFAAWEPGSTRPGEPFIYRSMEVPIFDTNLRNLSGKLAPTCALAHVRGVRLGSPERLTDTNLHPFRMPGTGIAFAHNGHLREFAQMRYALVPHIRADFLRAIDGTNDTAWLHALFLSQLDDPYGTPGPDELAGAVVKTLRLVRGLRREAGIDTSSPANLFVATGECVLACRFSYDYGWYPEGDALLEVDLPFVSLWYTLGGAYVQTDDEWTMSEAERPQSVLVASEPLTADSSTWFEVPEYALLVADRSGVDGSIRLGVHDLDV